MGDLNKAIIHKVILHSPLPTITTTHFTMIAGKHKRNRGIVLEQVRTAYLLKFKEVFKTAKLKATQ